MWVSLAAKSGDRHTEVMITFSLIPSGITHALTHYFFPFCRAKMKEALGGILFIDEAYGLDPSRSPYGRDCLEQLLANLTDPKFEGNMVVIIAGYSADIDKLMNSNPGMTR